MAKLTKEGRISVVATAEPSLSKAAAKRCTECVLNTIIDSLAHGNDVIIPGFGSFKVVETAARKGINPATGKKMTIPAGKRVKFKAGKTMKDAL